MASRAGSHGPQFTLAVDVGSSSIKAAIGDWRSGLRTVERRAVALGNSGGPGSLVRQLDPDVLWRQACLLARATRKAAGLRPNQVGAVAITSQRHAVAALDDQGRPVLLSPNTDLRGVFQGAGLDERVGDLVWRTTGHLPSAMQAWAKLLWLRDEEPEDFARVRWICGLADWLAYEMCGELRTERVAGAESGLIDLCGGERADALAARCGMHEIEVPLPVDPGNAIGGLSARAGRRLGVPAGIPVVAAGPDTQAGLLGMGLAAPGDVGIVAGWSCAVQQVGAAPVFDPERSLWTGRHVVRDLWTLEVNANVLGGAIDWLARLTAPSDVGHHALERFEREAHLAGPEASGIAAKVGPLMMDMGRPALQTGGILFPVPLAVSVPTRGDLARAAFESAAFSVRRHLERVVEVSGVAPRRVSLGGGMSRSRVFRKALAGVLDAPLRIGGPEATLSGALIQAGAVLRNDDPVRSVRDARHRRAGVVAIRRGEQAEYEERYGQWLEQVEALGRVRL